ncbi:MAG: aminotransferase class III-fold pyridoxal phosphate-dependent enzyme [Planctomycetaceae bacterium]|nr:aminotransferase class III-fold pyridoxal phosphate-dependent enzyme [Planctomycetaceae bacterium]
MSPAVERVGPAPIEHAGEDRSNEIRRRLAAVEPHCLRTYTPTLAVLAKSAGCYHWTPEGRKLADFTSGVLVTNLGHNPTRWWRRVLEYLGLDALPYTGEFVQARTLNAYNAITEIETVATERLVEHLRSQPGGEGLEQVLWAASGSEAVQKALWAALERRPGEDIILATRGGFHGKKGLAGAVTGCETDHDRDPRVKFIGFPKEECGSVERRRRPIDLAPYRQELDALWAEYGSRLCCLITEPYLGGGGSFHPQHEYLQLLAGWCHEHDVLFILDEVQANFGRTGSAYAFTTYGVAPDIVVLGKGLGNGVAVSAAVGRAEVFANLQYGAGSDTWSANPLASAAVLATLDEFETTDVLEHAAELSRVIEAGLVRLTELPAVERIRGEGVVWGIECAPVGRASAADVAVRAVEACYFGDAQGRAIHLLGPLSGKVLRVSPPLVMELDEAKVYLDALYEIFAALGKKLASA